MQIAYMNYLDVKHIFIYVNISYIHTNLKKINQESQEKYLNHLLKNVISNTFLKHFFLYESN